MAYIPPPKGETPEKTPEFYKHIMQRDQELILEQKAYISKLKAALNKVTQQRDSAQARLRAAK